MGGPLDDNDNLGWSEWDSIEQFRPFDAQRSERSCPTVSAIRAVPINASFIPVFSHQRPLSPLVKLVGPGRYQIVAPRQANHNP